MKRGKLGQMLPQQESMVATYGCVQEHGWVYRTSHPFKFDSGTLHPKLNLDHGSKECRLFEHVNLPDTRLSVSVLAFQDFWWRSGISSSI